MSSGDGGPDPTGRNHVGGSLSEGFEANQLRGLSMNSSADEAIVSGLSDASRSSILSASPSDRQSIIARLSPADFNQIEEMSENENESSTEGNTTTVSIIQSPLRRQRPSSCSTETSSRMEKREYK